jgi:hypothetical protein
MWKLTESQGGGNIGHAFGVNATDEASLTKAMVDGRRLMDPYRRYYTEYLTGFEKMELAATGAYLGVRESRRVVCDYTLCGQDFVDRAAFPDEIGRFSYPVDIHIMAPDKASYDNFQKEYTSLRYKPGESYGIPYRCLIPKKLGNVLTAGRCVGTDRQMQASIRVMPGCYITGQAAGIAATLALPTGNPRTINTATLQQKLRTLGAFLPV